MVGCGGSHQYRIWIPGTNKIKVSWDVHFVGEGTRNTVQVGTVGGYNDVGPHGDAVLYGNTASNGDAAPHRNGDEAQRKERIIYDSIKVLLPPGNEPLRESGSDSEAEGEFGTSDGSGESSETDGNESDIRDDDGIIRESTIESEPFVSLPSSSMSTAHTIVPNNLWRPYHCMLAP